MVLVKHANDWLITHLFTPTRSTIAKNLKGLGGGNDHVRMTELRRRADRDPKHPLGPPMTLGNMRHLGVHRSVAYYLNPSCRHEGAIYWMMRRNVSAHDQQQNCIT
jgi:hypothetical protein